MRISYILLVFLVAGCGKSSNTIQPTVKPLMEAVYASGFVVSEQEYQVYSQTDGTLKEVVVKEGEEVKKGQPLLIIESVQQNARYAITREAYDQAKRNKTPVLAELEATLRSAHTKMEFDSINFVRYGNLLKSNATSRIEYDRAEIQFKNSKNDFLTVKSRLTKTKSELDLAIQSAYNQLKIAEQESSNYVLRSDIDGMVFKVMKEIGELVRRSEVVAVVGKPSSFYLKLTVDELDIQRVKEGQKVGIKIDAYPDQLYNGHVKKIYPLVDTRQQSLRVDVTMDEKLPGLFSGLAVEANIIIREKKDALVLPKQALLAGDTLLVETANGNEKVKITRGIETLEEIEIVSGLNAESKVILN